MGAPRRACREVSENACWLRVLACAGYELEGLSWKTAGFRHTRSSGARACVAQAGLEFAFLAMPANAREGREARTNQLGRACCVLVNQNNAWQTRASPRSR